MSSSASASASASASSPTPSSSSVLEKDWEDNIISWLSSYFPEEKFDSLDEEYLFKLINKLTEFYQKQKEDFTFVGLKKNLRSLELKETEIRLLIEKDFFEAEKELRSRLVNLPSSIYHHVHASTEEVLQTINLQILDLQK